MVGIIKDFALEKVEWMTFMYGMKWVLPYFKDTVLAVMESTQHAEGMNSLFCSFVKKVKFGGIYKGFGSATKQT